MTVRCSLRVIVMLSSCALSEGVPGVRSFISPMLPTRGCELLSARVAGVGRRLGATRAAAASRLFFVLLSMLHARAAKTTAACASGTAWNHARRSPQQSDDAVNCLAHGQGSWKALPDNLLQTEPYLLSPSLKFGRESRHWWGVCDDDLMRNTSTGRPPRPAVLHQWRPEGNGCEALHKQQERLPDVGALACAFCARYVGRSILFVGDSVQGELFLAFASILGIVRAKPNSGQEGCRKVAPRGSGQDELDVSIETCGEAEQAVTVRFIRNEMLWLDNERNARTRHPDKGHGRGPPALMLCDWRWAAASADFLVLNRGYHSLTDPDAELHLQQLNETILELATLVRGSHSLRKRVVYRGTHGSLKNCAAQADPLTQPWNDIAAKMNSRANSQYNCGQPADSLCHSELAWLILWLHVSPSKLSSMDLLSSPQGAASRPERPTQRICLLSFESRTSIPTSARPIVPVVGCLALIGMTHCFDSHFAELYDGMPLTHRVGVCFAATTSAYRGQWYVLHSAPTTASLSAFRELKNLLCSLLASFAFSLQDDWVRLLLAHWT